MDAINKKDAFWFSHDSNAKDDPKCMLLIDQLGLEGYGIYWILVETLRDQPDYKYPLKLLPILAKRYVTSGEKMKAVVLNYELFQIENDQFFFSESLNNRMRSLADKRENARKAGIASAEKRKELNSRSTAVQQSFNSRSTSKVEESKKDINKTNETIKINFCDLENESWFLSILSFLNNKINHQKLLEYWVQYQKAMIADDDLYRDILSYRSHFRNWVKIQVEKSNDENVSSIQKPNYELLSKI